MHIIKLEKEHYESNPGKEKMGTTKVNLIIKEIRKIFKLFHHPRKYFDKPN